MTCPDCDKNKELFELELEQSYKDVDELRKDIIKLRTAVNLCTVGGHLKEEQLKQAEDFVKRFFIL